MNEFAEKITGMEADGVFSTEEKVAAAAVVLLLLILIFVVRKLMVRSTIRKTSIFRMKKNKYKSRLGKKNIKY